MFTFNYGVSLVDTSYNFIMKNKRLVMNMFIPYMLSVIITNILTMNSYVLPKDIPQMVYLFHYLCMVPLIYHIVRIVRGDKKPNLAASNTIISRLIPIGFFILLSVASQVLGGQMGALFLKLLNYYRFIRVETSSLYFNLFALFLFYFAIAAVTIISYFLLFLLVYFVLVVAVVEETDIITTLKKSFMAAKNTIYSIIGGSIWFCIFGVLLFLTIFLAVAAGILLLFSILFFVIKLTSAPALLWAQFADLTGIIISSISAPLSYALFATLYTTFQTLLYLKYKEVTAADTVAQNVDLVPEQ